MPSQMVCDFYPASYIDNDSRFRAAMDAMDFEAPGSGLLIKASFSEYYPLTWPADESDGYYGPVYETPPQPMDSQFLTPSAMAQPPPPSVKSDDQPYFYVPEQLELAVPITITEAPDKEFNADNQFGKHPYYPMEAQKNDAISPSTIVQEMDPHSDVEVEVHDERERPRPSRKNSKKDPTPSGVKPQGNNPFGSKGTHTCANCRRRKGRVLSLVHNLCGYTLYTNIL